MKKFLGLSLLVILTTIWTVPSVAKKYRYIKREHGVKFQGNIPFSLNLVDQISNINLSVDLEGAYAYNWKGFVEVGPYFNLSLTAMPNFSFSHWSAGLTGEYNFIKNRGRRKLIPSLGLQLGAISSSQFKTKNIEGNSALHGNAGLHASLKWFVATRTALITTLSYDAIVPFSFDFSALGHHVDLKMGFAHYFDSK